MTDGAKNDQLVGQLFRLAFMILFSVLLQVAIMVLWPLVILQLLFSLFTGSDNEQLRLFGSSLSKYVQQILSFLTYNTEEKPYPFRDWPSK